jgi:hypothetical protein
MFQVPLAANSLAIGDMIELHLFMHESGAGAASGNIHFGPLGTLADPGLGNALATWNSGWLKQDVSFSVVDATHLDVAVESRASQGSSDPSVYGLGQFTINRTVANFITCGGQTFGGQTLVCDWAYAEKH